MSIIGVRYGGARDGRGDSGRYLWSKSRKFDALHAGTTNDGEREAARLAAERIRTRLAVQRTEWWDIVMSYSLHDPWKRKLFVALCRRYGLAPFWEPG